MTHDHRQPTSPRDHRAGCCVFAFLVLAVVCGCAVSKTERQNHAGQNHAVKPPAPMILPTMILPQPRSAVGKALDAVAPPPAAKTNITITWQQPQDVWNPAYRVAQIWSTQDLSLPFTVKATTRSNAITFPLSHAQEFFIVRIGYTNSNPIAWSDFARIQGGL